MATKARQADITEAREYLLTLIKPGDVVHTQVKHVSRSGMSRVIGAYLVRDSEVYDISRRVADAIDSPFDENHWGVKMGGAGMDMTFYLVYCLGRALWPEGVHCTGSNGYTPSGRKSKLNRCHSNDHVNDHTMPYRKSTVHRDGGYALTRSHLS